MQQAFALGVTLGIASALHCVAMCGSLNAFVALAPDGATNPWRVAMYQLGRVGGYTTLGAILGAMGGTLAELVPPAAEALLSILLGLGLGLAAFQLWPRSETARPLVALGRSPSAPSLRDRLTRRFVAVLSQVRRAPLLLGALSALLPCGVIASGALLAASTGQALTGAAAMGGLAVTSGLAVAVAGMALGRVRIGTSKALARTMAITLALGAVVLCARPAWVTPDDPARCHSPH